MSDLTIEQTDLEPIVRMLFDGEKSDGKDIVLQGWQWRALGGGFGHAYGVCRFQGEAAVNGESRHWSAVLKIVGPETGSRDPSARNYWKREALVYQSGLLNDLGGDLIAPRCLGVTKQPDGEFWIWLEDIHESGDGDWPLERYGLAARHLGQFNGAYLSGRPLPEKPWLSKGRYRERLVEAEPGVAELPRLCRNSIFAGMSTDESIAHALRQWAERDRLLAALDRLPVTLCHHDAFRNNLIARDDVAGQRQTVAVDWAMLGSGVIGEEIAHLFAVSLTFVAVELKRIAELDALIFGGYVDGLRDAGWQGDPRLARLGYAVTAVLSGLADRGIKWPRVAKRVAALPPGAERPRLLNPGGVPQSAAKHQHLLTLGDEAMVLLEELR